MTRLFFFGTLCDLELLEIVLGRRPVVVPARMEKATAVWVKGEDFPICIPADGVCEGILTDPLSDEEMARVDFYEVGFGYAREGLTVETDGEAVSAEFYTPPDGFYEHGPEWDLSDWQTRFGAITRETALEAMTYVGKLSPADMARLWPVMAARAQSRIAARTRPPTKRTDLPSRSDVDIVSRSLVYNKFFQLEEYKVRFPRFNGHLSETVDRAVFVSVDAITLLPYDPVRDRVLLVDQFRIGPYVRGDAQPWTLEPVAGRVDGGETWEDAAYRETVEETGVDLWHIEKIGTYYPSPGAKTEYLCSFIGLADLPESSTGLFGVEYEDEDIKTRLFSFDEFMEMTRDGRVQNGPLMISALWLSAERARLRTIAKPDSETAAS